MPKDKRHETLKRKGKSLSGKPGRTAPIALTQAAVDGLLAGDRKIRKEVTQSLARATPSDSPADTQAQEGPKSLPMPVTADEMKKIRKSRRLPREIVARLLDRKAVDAPRKTALRKHEEPTRKREG